MPLSFSHISHSSIALDRERERERESIVDDEKLFLLLGFYTVLVEFYIGEVLWVFSLVVSTTKIFVFSCVDVFVFFSVIL